jgi:hypothetical protein
MPLKSVSTLLSVSVVVVVIAVSITIYINYYSISHFDFAPIQRNADSLSQQEVETILSKRFKRIRRVRQIPPTVKQSFTNVTGVPFAMSDPGGPMSTDDLTSGAPSRRFIFVGLADNSAILVYEEGSFVDYEMVMVLSFSDRGSAWAASPDHYVRDIDGLRAVIRRKQFHEQKMPFF